MLKKLSFILVGVCLLFALTACGDSSDNSEKDNDSSSLRKSYTYSVETGDKVKLSLDISDKYDITSELPFTISYDGKDLSQGTFITSETYAQYVEVVDTQDGAVLIDSGSKDGNEYIFWSYNNSEYNYAVLIKDSNTGIILGNAVSEESAKECFERITVSIEK